MGWTPKTTVLLVNATVCYSMKGHLFSNVYDHVYLGKCQLNIYINKSECVCLSVYWNFFSRCQYFMVAIPVLCICNM